MTVIVVAIALTLLVIAAVLAYKKDSKEAEEAAVMLLRLIEEYGNWDVKKLRKDADNIISGSLKVDDVGAAYLTVVGLYLGLKTKQAKEGEPDYAKDSERIEQLKQLVEKNPKTSKNNK